MSIGKVTAIPAVLSEVMENPIPVDGEGPLYQDFLREVVADLQPKTMLDKIRVIRWVQCEWGASRLRRYRRLLLEGKRAASLEKEVHRANFGGKRKPTPRELQMVKRAAERMMDGLSGIRLDNLSARAVCQAADDLQKMDALIERADYWCAIMRAECDPLFGRALRAGKLELTQQAGEENQVSTKPDLAPIEGDQETLVEPSVPPPEMPIEEEATAAAEQEAASANVAAQ